MTVIEYNHNNSGGGWWLTDDDWRNLEKAGWKVNWIADNPLYAAYDDRFLGALATSAERRGLSVTAAIDEWEKVTGLNAWSEGCECCGQPHYFYVSNEDTVYLPVRRVGK